MGSVRGEIAEPSTGMNSSSLFTIGRSRLVGAAYQANKVFRQSRLGAALVGSVPRPVKEMAKSLLWKTAERDHDFVLAQAGPYRMWVPYRFRQSYVIGEYERFTAALFKESLWPGQVVLDVGANVGFYTLLASSAVGPEGHVFAFEPAPDTVRMLRRNVEMNQCDNVSCIAAGVGDKAAFQDLMLVGCPGSNSFNPNPLFTTTGSVRVECVTLDEFLDGRMPHAVKIDAEGGEISVLEGMRETLRRSTSMRLFVELNPPCLQAAGRSPRDLVAILRENDFMVEVVDEATGDRRELDERLEGVPLDNPGYWTNLYCTKGCVS